MPGESVSVENNVVYAVHDGQELKGTLYRPAGAGPFPAVVALHGGGWRQASPTIYQHLGPYLAAQGFVVFAPVYRSAAVGKPSYPNAVHDVRAAVQFVKGARDLTRADPERVALMGESAGGHLAALVALAGDEEIFTRGAPQGPHASLSVSVKAAIPIYGVFDLVAQWRHDLVTRLGDQNIVELFLGTNPSKDRRICFDASPMSYCIERLAKPAFLVAWGAQDDIVNPATQSERFVEALKQAGAWTRTVVVGDAPHYWAGDPLDETASHAGYFAPRLLRFLKARL
jgi:acetyl esterase/lipase